MSLHNKWVKYDAQTARASYPVVRLHTMNDNAQSKIVIKPHLLPRSLPDFLITFLILPLQLGGLFVVPALVTFLVFYSCMLAFLVSLVIYFVFLALSVWSITLSKDGIHFRRLLDSPKMLPWSDVVSIEVAPRWELIRKGWLWPLIPAREMTTSLSSLGHYRITWADGFCYYPPLDVALFENHVSKFLANRVSA